MVNNFEEIGSFFIIKGDIKKSIRFKYPIKVDRDFCNEFSSNIEERTYDWKNDMKYDNQIIGSYTRTIRAILDSSETKEKFHSFLYLIKDFISE